MDVILNGKTLELNETIVTSAPIEFSFWKGRKFCIGEQKVSFNQLLNSIKESTTKDAKLIQSPEYAKIKAALALRRTAGYNEEGRPMGEKISFFTSILTRLIHRFFGAKDPLKELPDPSPLTPPPLKPPQEELPKPLSENIPVVSQPIPTIPLTEVPLNPEEKEFQENQKLAESGDPTAQWALVYNFLNGIATTKSDEKGIALLEKLGRNGDVKAQLILSFLLIENMDILSAKEKREYWFPKLTHLISKPDFPLEGLTQEGNEGKVQALYCLFMVEKLKGNAEDAFTWIMKAAEQGDVRARYIVADCYMDGFGVPKDIQKGFNLFKVLSDKGDFRAKGSLIDFYSIRGDVQNFPLANRLLKELAAQGSPYSKWLLIHAALMGDPNLNISKNPKAMDEMKKLGEEGNSWANYTLGSVYAQGADFGSLQSKIEKNKKMASEYFLKAAREGHVGAAFALGKLYAECISGYDLKIGLKEQFAPLTEDRVEPDGGKAKIEAIKWLKIAASYKVPRARRTLKIVRSL